MMPTRISATPSSTISSTSSVSDSCASRCAPRRRPRRRAHVQDHAADLGFVLERRGGRLDDDREADRRGGVGRFAHGHDGASAAPARRRRPAPPCPRVRPARAPAAPRPARGSRSSHLRTGAPSSRRPRRPDRAPRALRAGPAAARCPRRRHSSRVAGGHRFRQRGRSARARLRAAGQRRGEFLDRRYVGAVIGPPLGRAIEHEADGVEAGSACTTSNIARCRGRSNQMWVWKSNGLAMCTRVGEDLAQALRAAPAGIGANCSPRSRATSAVIAMSPPEAPITSTRAAAQRTAGVEDLERFAQRARATRSARCPPARRRHRTRASAPASAPVWVRTVRVGRLGAAGLDQRDRLAGGARHGRGRARSAATSWMPSTYSPKAVTRSSSHSSSIRSSTARRVWLPTVST